MIRTSTRLAALLAASLALAGCSTGYGNARTSLTGGYLDEAGPARLHTVSFFGNGYTPHEHVRHFLMRRCAEVAQAAGHPWFLVYDDLMSAGADRPTTGLVRIEAVGGHPYATVYILGLEAEAPGALETAEVLRRYAGEPADATPAVDGAKKESRR